MKKTTLFGNSVIFNSAYYVAEVGKDGKERRVTQDFTFQSEAEDAKARMKGGNYKVVRAA